MLPYESLEIAVVTISFDIFCCCKTRADFQQRIFWSIGKTTNGESSFLLY